MNKKKITTLALSSALLFSGAVPTSVFVASNVISAKSTAADTDSSHETQSVVQSEISEEQLIERVRELFPDKFDFIQDDEFEMRVHHYDPEEGRKEYSLDFSKQMNQDYVHAQFSFNENLELQSFYYRPATTKEALFPPEVTKEEAEKIAKDFLEKLHSDDSFQLNDVTSAYYGTNQTLTEPIEYRFIFEKTFKGVPVNGQSVSIEVLGNGEVSRYYTYRNNETPTFEQKGNVLSKEDALKSLKDNIKLDLRYRVNYDYRGEDISVDLIYQMDPTINGVDAQSGQLRIGQKFVDQLPETSEIKMLKETPVQREQKPLTKEDVQALSKQLLEPEDDHIKLYIEQITEENRYGIETYAVHYMYRTGNSGFGSAIHFNKHTGELIDFYKDSYRGINEEETSKEPQLTKEEALEKAIEYIETYASPNMHHFAYPLDTLNAYDERTQSYSFLFPRIKKGVTVDGNYMRLRVSAEDGSLLTLNQRFHEIEKWPDIEDAVAKDKALKAFKDNIDVMLKYMDLDYADEKSHYELVYTLQYNKPASYYDAVKGEWVKYSTTSDSSDSFKVEDHAAEKELNYLIEANILTVEDPENFDPDETLTKGKALEILLKSFERYYSYDDYGQEGTFDNIDSDHPLFGIIERSVDKGILDASQPTFDADGKMNKEQLAIWYTRILGLDVVAQHTSILKLDFDDIDSIDPDNQGYAAIVHGLNILPADENNEFNPDEEISYADMAVSLVKLAKMAQEMKTNY